MHCLPGLRPDFKSKSKTSLLCCPCGCSPRACFIGVKQVRPALALALMQVRKMAGVLNCVGDDRHEQTCPACSAGCSAALPLPLRRAPRTLPSLVQGVRRQQGVARHTGVPQPAGGDRPAVQPLPAGVQRLVPAQPAAHQAVPAGEMGSTGLAWGGMGGACGSPMASSAQLTTHTPKGCWESHCAC